MWRIRISYLADKSQVNCLMDWFYDDGLRQAEELDKFFKNTGELKGPLHGVPIALKVQSDGIIKQKSRY